MKFKFGWCAALVLCAAFAGCVQKSGRNEADVTSIRQVLQQQVVAWNTGNIDQFMEGYWKSDSILFIGSSVTQGWTATLNRYRKSYPDKAAMGILSFEIFRVDWLAEGSYLVTGKYHLQRAADAPEGIFTLLFQKKEGRWAVVYDHTS
jgi:hypothetical protein